MTANNPKAAKSKKKSGRGEADFHKDTIEALGRRAGHKCCFPGCKAVLSGPSAESSMATTYLGTAAHIVAAADGPSARRVDTNMSEKDKANIKNGIYMCRNHGKAIDDDECTYSIQVLEGWKAIAEGKQAIRQRLSREDIEPESLKEMPLVPATHVFNLGSGTSHNDRIKKALRDSCLTDLWGHGIAVKVGEFLMEYFKNAESHGGATEIVLEVSPRKITVTDNGSAYTPSMLRKHESGRGGQESLAALENEQVSRLAMVCEREVNHNRLIIRYLWDLSDIAELAPCTSCGEVFNMPDLNGAENCDKIYYAIMSAVSYSEIGLLNTIVTKAGDRPCVLVFDEMSAELLSFYRKNLPDVEILALSVARD